MKNCFRKITLLLAFSIIAMFSLVGCGTESKAKEAFNTYKDHWINKDYSAMYDMLSNESKKYISKEDFVSRYENIYSAIDAKDMKINVLENTDKSKKRDPLKVSFDMTMDSIVGNLDLKGYLATLVKEDKQIKISWSESLIFPEMRMGDKVRVNNNKAERGNIFDKNGKLLATTGIIKSVGIHPSEFENPAENVKEMASILDISEETIQSKLDANKNPDHLVPVVDVLQSDSGKVDALSKIKGVVITDKKSRIYNGGEAFGSLIGYIGPITQEELEKNKDKGYTPYSIVGKAGLESVYEDKLRGEDGSEIYIERGDQKIDIAKKDVKNGQDLKLSIDADLQSKIYSEMEHEKGASTAIDPKSGEILAMVSSPSYDPNIFVTYTTRAQSETFKKNNNTEFDNKFNNVYSPGSTMKLITASIGLDDNVVTPQEGMNISGLHWQKDNSWGGYTVTRVTDPGRPVDLRTATKYSDNIYFAQVALRLGAEKYIEGAKNFGIGEAFNCGFPVEDSQLSNDGKLANEILLADTGYGQGQVMISPPEMALAYSALGNGGNIMKPRLVVSDEPTASVWKTAIKPENLPPLIDAFSAVVNDADATGHSAKIDGINIAGKTGTAELKKDLNDTSAQENGWFVAVNTDDPKISISMIVENVKYKGGGHFITTKVKNIMEYYLKK